MKIEASIKTLQNISFPESENKSSIKLKNRFVDVLLELNSMDLTKNQKSLLEAELDNIFKVTNLERVDKREIKIRYRSLIDFLNKELFLIPDGHYMMFGAIGGMIMGTILLSFSIVFTEAFFKFFLPLAGLMIGLLIGSAMDLNARKQNRTFKVRMY